MNTTENLTIFEQRVIVEFLKDNIDKDTLSKYQPYVIRHLFLAFLKLQHSIDLYEEGSGYTE